jgi:CBS domain-containing protein
MNAASTGDPCVADLMNPDLVTIDPDATAAAAAERMLETGVGSILAVDDTGRLEGLLTSHDFVALVRENDPNDQTPVEVCLTTNVLTVSPTDPITALGEAHLEYTHIPVVDDDVVVGMVSTTDLTEQFVVRQ